MRIEESHLGSVLDGMETELLEIIDAVYAGRDKVLIGNHVAGVLTRVRYLSSCVDGEPRKSEAVSR
jgi:hypothetical protein